MDVCRWEFVGITLMALTSEMDESDFINIKTDYSYGEYIDYADFENYYEVEEALDAIAQLDWYQTAFMTLADEACV
jgi:hypothetical protein